MKCRYCGQEIDKASKYCKYCGYLYKYDDISKKAKTVVHKENRPKKGLSILLTFLLVSIILGSFLGLKMLFRVKTGQEVEENIEELEVTSQEVTSLAAYFDNIVFASYFEKVGSGDLNNSITNNAIGNKHKVLIAFESLSADQINKVSADSKILDSYTLESCYGEDCFITKTWDKIDSANIQAIKERVKQIFGESVLDNIDFTVDYETEDYLLVNANNAYNKYVITINVNDIEYNYENLEAYKSGKNLVIKQKWIIGDLKFKLKQIFKQGEDETYYWYGCELYE